MCGGGESPATHTSCITLSWAGAGAGLWAECHALLQGRDGHSSWGSPAGVLLLGGYPGHGYDSLRSTELLSTTDSSSQQAFDLEYDTASVGGGCG